MKNYRGYTLLELLFSMAIAGILLTLAISYWHTARLQHQLETQTNLLFDNIQFARNAALSSQAPISVCPSDDGKSCVNTSEKGWIIFNKSSTNTVIRHYTLCDSCKLIWQGLGNNNYLQFNAEGNAQGYNGNFTNLIADQKTTYQKTIIISPTGRARVV